jgi:hypothetical protein
MSYKAILAAEGPWFRMAYRLIIREYPCLQCTFALATHGRFDAAFGVGEPWLCADCAKANTDEEWRLVDPKDYDRDARAIIKALGTEWAKARIP